MHSAQPLHPDALTPSLAPNRGKGRARRLNFGEWLKKLTSFLALGFSIDLRSLAAFRIAFGLLLLRDMGLALSNVRAFYSDEGTMPRTLLLSSDLCSDLWWSLNMMSGIAWFQMGLFGMGMGLALMLILGWRTRLATIAAWVLVCSMQARNPSILHGGDDVTRVMLFWAFFLPLGARWSLDARLARRRLPLTGSITTLPGACLLLQMGIIYLFSILLKTDPVWRPGGAGLRIALQMDHFVRPAGIWLRDHDVLCRWFTTWTVVLEAGVAWLAFMPFCNAMFRFLVVGLFWSFHAGIWLFMDVGPFCIIMAAAWLPFLPGSFWTWLGRGANRVFKGWPSLRSRALRATAGFIHLFRRRLSPFFRWQSTADYGLRPAWPAKVVTSFCLLYSLGWNLRDLDGRKFEPYFPNAMIPLGHALRWEQYWGMFAPKPMLDDGWYVCAAKLADGEEVDLLRRGTPVEWNKPAVVSQLFWDSRWQKYLSNLWTKRFETFRVPLLKYLSQEWNDSHGTLQRVTEVHLWYVIEMTNPDGSKDKTRRPAETARYFPPVTGT